LHDQAVVAIEWADKLLGSLPERHLTVNLEIVDDKSRTLSMAATGHHEANLIKALEDRL
jgi:tRNA A37 threonylcarbamoyladenosine biosynthesis protein TsaE